MGKQVKETSSPTETNLYIYICTEVDEGVVVWGTEHTQLDTLFVSAVLQMGFRSKITKGNDLRQRDYDHLRSLIFRCD